MNGHALLEKVKQAFPVTPRPDMTLRQGQLADQSLSREISDAEWDAEGELDREMTWLGLGPQDLIACEAALSHLSDGGFVYYLPAFLAFGVQHLNSQTFAEERVVNAVICAVTQLSNYNLARLKHLSDDQIDVVTQFVGFVRDSVHSEVYRQMGAEALRGYWETPDARRRTIIQAP